MPVSVTFSWLQGHRGIRKVKWSCVLHKFLSSQVQTLCCCYVCQQDYSQNALHDQLLFMDACLHSAEVSAVALWQNEIFGILHVVICSLSELYTFMPILATFIKVLRSQYDQRDGTKSCVFWSTSYPLSSNFLSMLRIWIPSSTL